MCRLKHLGKLWIRDVKTVYFLEPVAGLPKTGFLPATERLVSTDYRGTGVHKRPNVSAEL